MRKTKKTGHPAWTWMAAAAVLGFTVITAGAADPALIEPERKGSILLSLYDQESGSAVADGVFTLVQVAALRTEETEETEAAYLYTSDFADCTISLADVSQASLAAELDAWVNAHAVPGMKEASPDAEGHLAFSDLPLGLYLIRQTVNAAGYEQILPFLVTVPFPDGESWIYDVDAGPKVRLLREEKPEEKPKEEPEEKPKEEPEEKPKEEPEEKPKEEPEEKPKEESEKVPEEEPETESETQTEQESETQTEEAAVPGAENGNGQPRSVKTGDTTPVTATFVLLFAGAALFAAGAAGRHRTHGE